MAGSFQSRADRLKLEVERSTDLMEPWKYFQDELASSPGFLDLGAAEDNSNLFDVLAGAASQVFGRKLEATRRALIHIPEFHLWHGAFLLGNFPAGVVYFDDIDTGMVGILSDLRLERVEILRLSLYRLPPNTAPSTTTGSA